MPAFMKDLIKKLEDTENRDDKITCKRFFVEPDSQPLATEELDIISKFISFAEKK
jgi:hypothetical protein